MSAPSPIEHHPLVSVRPRFVAQLVDTAVVVLLTACLALVLTGKGLEEPGRPAVWTGMFVIWLLYFTICEWRGGQTIGKKLRGIEVRSLDGGGQPSLRQAFIRTVLRLVDGLALYLVGAVAVWTSDQRQRLGDRVAGTVVVRSRPDAPTLYHDGTHARDQEEPDAFVPEVEAELARPPQSH